MKPIPYILLLALCGCVATKPDINQLYATVGSRPIIVGSNVSAKSVIVPLSETITASWRNNNTGNPDVITFLQSTTDLTSGNWVTLWETNCDDEITVATIPRPQVPTTFYRNGNRLIE